jgi:hypothetical protein
VSAQFTDLLTNFVAAVLLTGGILKASGFQSFQQSLYFVPHIPYRFVGSLALLVPLAEITLATGVLAGLDVAIYGTVFLFLTFAVVSYMTARLNLGVSCTCFGTLSSGMTLSKGTSVINLLLAALLIPGIANGSAASSLQTFVSGLTVFLCCVLGMQVYSNEVRTTELRNGAVGND